MSLVVDASVIAALLLPDERTSDLDGIHVRMGQTGAVAPALLWYEIRNAVLVNERRGRLSTSDIDRIFDALATLPVKLTHRQSSADILALARRHSLTFYDASYLQLAKTDHLPLATLDRALAQAARAESVALLT